MSIEQQVRNLITELVKNGNETDLLSESYRFRNIAGEGDQPGICVRVWNGLGNHEGDCSVQGAVDFITRKIEKGLMDFDALHWDPRKF